MATSRRDVLVGVIAGCVMSTIFAAIGIWRLRVGWSAVTSMELLSKDDLVIGAFFAFAGLWGWLFTLAHVWERTPNVVYACLWSAFSLNLASPFLYAGIAHPERINGSASIAGLGLSVSQKPSASLGGAVFILAGIFVLLLVANIAGCYMGLSGIHM